jgi:PAS domain S-box-containing protein
MPENNVPQLIEALEAFEDGIYIINKEYTIVYMNKAMKQIFGNGVKKKCYEFINKEKNVCPWCHYDKVFKNGNNHYGEIFIPSAEKSFYFIEVPVTDTNGDRVKMSILRDITREKKQAQKLKTSEEDYKRLFEHAGCGVYRSSKQGKFIDVNPALLNMLGYSDKKAFLKLDLATDLYLKPEHRRAYQDIVETKGGVINYEVEWKRQDGSIAEVMLTSNVLYDTGGAVLGYEGFVVDLGEKIKMERKLSETRQQLLQSEKLAAMGRLTSQIAHELNNPLFGIMNTLELMKTEISPQNKRRRLLDLSLTETVRLADMLKKMISFSRPDQEAKANININTVLEEIMLLYEKKFKENSIKYNASLTQITGIVHASKGQLRQVFLNMFSNAMDAMPNGGTLSVTTTVRADKIRILISDTGSGIKQEHKEKIFDSFFTTKTDSVKGVGLGLSVCYGFIKEHDGDIQVESEPGTGTSFVISLPVRKDAIAVRESFD